jgi:hypothetical protein
MTKVICKNKSCKTEFNAKPVDIKRGWGKFCSKSCKAIKQSRDSGYHDYLRERDKHDIHDEAMTCAEIANKGF